MIKVLWGQKVGMTQKFVSNKVVPATVVFLGDWKVLQRKTVESDGYEAIQIGYLRQKYAKLEFSMDWLKNKKKHFLFLKEVYCEKGDSFEIGSTMPLENIFSEGSKIAVTGKTIGKGFQGCVKRHGFTGGRASHGDKLGRKPGSLSGLRTQGFVSKGKKMPGHDGVGTKTIISLTVLDFIPSEKIMVIRGSVPGKSGSLVRISRDKRTLDGK